MAVAATPPFQAKFLYPLKGWLEPTPVVGSPTNNTKNKKGRKRKKKKDERINLSISQSTNEQMNECKW